MTQELKVSNAESPKSIKDTIEYNFIDDHDEEARNS